LLPAFPDASAMRWHFSCCWRCLLPDSSFLILVDKFKIKQKLLKIWWAVR
jgi:hypothetical protein